MKKSSKIKESVLLAKRNSIFLLVSVILALVFAFYLRSVLMPFLLAVIISYLFNPIVGYFENKKVKRIFVVLTLFIIFIAAVTLLMNVFTGVIGNEISNIKDKLPLVSSKVDGIAGKIAELVNKVAPDVSSEKLKTKILLKVSSIPENTGEYISRIFSTLASGIGGILGGVLNGLIVMVASFFLLKDWKKIVAAVKSIIPAKYIVIVDVLGKKVNEQVSNYVRGQLIVASLVGVIATLGLLLLGFEYAFLVGAVAGITNLVPLLGPITGMCVGVVLSVFTPGPFFSSALKVLSVLAVVQLLDNTLISPMVIGKNVKIHPVTVLMALAIGSYLMGVWGMLIAVPAYASLKVIFIGVQEQYLKNRTT